MTKISICIPTFNGSRYFEDALRSALNQTFEDFEVVVCDDASTDNTLEIARSFDDKRLKILEFKNNLGLAGNWNRATQYCSGDLIKFLFQDDILHSDALSRFYQSNIDYPDCALHFSANEQIGCRGEQLIRRRPYKQSQRFTAGLLTHDLLFRGNIVGGPSNVMVQRRALLSGEMFDNRSIFSLDLLMWIKLTAKTPASYICESLVHVREHEGSATTLLTKRGATAIDDYNVLCLLAEDQQIESALLQRAKRKYLFRFSLRVLKAYILRRIGRHTLLLQYKSVIATHCKV